MIHKPIGSKIKDGPFICFHPLDILVLLNLNPVFPIVTAFKCHLFGGIRRILWCTHSQLNDLFWLFEFVLNPSVFHFSIWRCPMIFTTVNASTCSSESKFGMEYISLVSKNTRRCSLSLRHRRIDYILFLSEVNTS